MKRRAAQHKKVSEKIDQNREAKMKERKKEIMRNLGKAHKI